jgi:hypothetical protein
MLDVATAVDQPSSVREVIGKQGERPKGPLANREAGSRAVRYTTTFQVRVAMQEHLR